MKFKKITLLLILLLALLSGCQQQEAETPSDEPPIVETPVQGGVVTVGLDTNNLVIDPLGNKKANNPIYQIDAIIYRGLAKYNEQLQLSNDLAKSYSIDQELNTISIKLKENLKFSDGTPITFEDLLFTYNFYSNKDYQGKWKDYTFNIQGSADYRTGKTEEVTGIIFNQEENTLTINYDYLDVEDIQILAAPILSKKQLEGKTINEINQLAAAGEILATGPYQFKSSNNNELILQRNKYYEENTYLDQIQFVNKKAGQEYDLELALPHEVTTDIEGRKTVTIPGNSYQYLGFNLNKDEFKDITLRKALASTLDEQKIIDTIYQGFANRPSSPIHQDSWSYKEVNQELMTEEEIKSTLSGKSFSFNLAYEDFPIYEDMAEEIASQLSGAGVKVNLNPIPQGEYISRLFYQGGFDLFIASWPYELDPMYENEKWLSKKDVINGGFNVSHVNDETSDEFLITGKTTIDNTKRKGIYGDWQDYFMNQYYYAPIASSALIFSVSDNLTIDINSSFVPYENIENWWTKQESEVQE